MTESIGMLAAICTTLAFWPQVVKVWKTRSAGDISLGMYVVFCAGVALWLVYGMLIRSTPLLFANAVTLVLAASVLVMKLAWDRRAPATLGSDVKTARSRHRGSPRGPL